MVTCPACDATITDDMERCQQCNLELKPYRLLLTLPIGYFNAGLSKAHNGDFDEAIEHFAVAAALNRHDADAELVLGKLYAQKKNMHMARLHFERAKVIQEQQKVPEDVAKTTQALLTATEPISISRINIKQSHNKKRRKL
jgi:tetratricopeptide (TPR) repeat protein